ncbi:MAG: rod shape-determining protein MreC [Bacteroidota bacterium]
MQSNRKLKNNYSSLPALFTFLCLELICFLLIVTQNSRQRGIATQTWSVYTSAASGKVSSWWSVFSYPAKMDSVQSREGRWRERIIAAKLSDSLDQQYPGSDTISGPHNEQYSLSAARIVSKQPYSNAGNSFIINRGTNQGVSRGQGIIGRHGPLGVVTDVKAHNARVMSILHPDLRVSTALSTNEYGTLQWDSEDPRKAILLYIPDYVSEPLDNDTLYTTGYSSVFPTGLPIGRSSSYTREEGTGFWKIEVDLFEDYLSIDRVFVVKNLYKPELDSLRNLQ